MPLRIVPAEEPIEVRQITVVIVGQPGIGKSTIGQTAEKPLTLDFDRGLHRTPFRRDSSPVDAWEEVAQVAPKDYEAFSTLVIDTAGRMLDKIAAHLISETPKFATRAGALTLPGYGELGAVFNNWTKQLIDLGKDLVLLCHDAEDKRGDDLIVRPDLAGNKSRHELMRIADAVGYLYMRGKDVVLDFSPSSSWFGKNPGGFDPIVVPRFADGSAPTFLAEIIAKTKAKLNARTLAQAKAAEMLAHWQIVIDSLDAEKPETFTAVVAEIGQLDAGAVRDNVRRMLLAAAKKAGLVWSKDQAAFQPKAA